MKILRVAVVGLGRIGWLYHIKEILDHNGFELVAVTDPSAERLEEAEREFNVNSYKDYKKMIDEEDLDMVVIASPTIFHKEQTIYAMENGLNVLLEKPMGCSVEEADQMITTMKRTGRKLMVYQPHRATSETQALKSLLESNKIGKVYMIKRAYSQYLRRNDWQSLKKNSGGMLYNYGAHYIDQVLYLTESSAKTISCQLRKIASLGDAEDVVKLVIETDDDIILDIDINQASAAKLTPWVILGEYGSITGEYINDELVFYVKYLRKEELDDLKLHDQMAAPGRTYSNGENLIWHEEKIKATDYHPIDFYDKFYSYFALDEQPFVPIHETREVMRIISECQENT